MHFHPMLRIDFTLENSLDVSWSFCEAISIEIDVKTRG